MATKNKAAGEALTVKKVPHRPGTAPALGLRAGSDVLSLYCRPSERNNPMRRATLFQQAIALTLAIALAPTIPSTARADTVTDWNANMQATVAAAPTNANYQARWGAIVQLAVFEAVNAIEK